jgi:hypothetical protein
VGQWSGGLLGQLGSWVGAEFCLGGGPLGLWGKGGVGVQWGMDPWDSVGVLVGLQYVGQA